jgi:GNAT superfamily N-acetyltransferase
MNAVDVFYLQMLSPLQLRSKNKPTPDVQLIEACEPLPELNRFLYTAVGGDWFWVDRLPWTYAQWQSAVGHKKHRTFVAYSNGTPAGYFELQLDAESGVELQYFGLLPGYYGRGLGGWLLSEAIQAAWAWQAKRVWVHTCTLDHPSALQNYLARGFVHYGSDVEQRNLPAKPPGPWPGAQK